MPTSPSPPGPPVASAWLHRVDAMAACHIPGDPAAPVPAGRAPWTLTVVCGASALLMFNVTAPNVALPAIGRALDAGFGELQWVLSAYAMVLAGLLLAGGALADRYGRRSVFLSGLVVFAFGSLLCTVAGGSGVLIAGRVVQGVGAAGLFPAGLALIGGEYAGAARARAIGVWGAAVAVTIALGPLCGGVLVAVAGWRAEFGAAVVLAVPALAVGRRHLRGPGPSGGSLDWAGTVLLSGASFLAVLVLSRGSAWAWGGSVTAGVCVLALVLVFGVVEHRAVAPLMDPHLLRNPAFVAATGVALLFAAAAFAPLVYITQYLLTVGGAGPALAGAEIAPFGVAAFAVSLGAASVVARIGTRATLVAGLVLCGAGLVVLVLLGPPGSPVRLLPGLLLFGAGAGLVNPTMTVVALGSVPVEHAGTAAGVNNAARQFGIAAGIAGFGAVVHGPLMDASVVIRADALDRVLLLGVGLTTAAVLLVLLLVRGGPDPRPT